MKFFTKYSKNTKDYGFACEGESLTRQSEADSCDINKIMERFDRTGQLPISLKQPPQYGDARIVSFQEAKQIVIEAEKQFMELSPQARQYFGHDPQNLLNAIADDSEDNIKKLLDLGIMVQKEKSPEQILNEIAQNTKKEPAQ